MMPAISDQDMTAMLTEESRVRSEVMQVLRVSFHIPSPPRTGDSFFSVSANLHWSVSGITVTYTDFTVRHTTVWIGDMLLCVHFHISCLSGLTNISCKSYPDLSTMKCVYISHSFFLMVSGPAMMVNCNSESLGCTPVQKMKCTPPSLSPTPRHPHPIRKKHNKTG